MSEQPVRFACHCGRVKIEVRRDAVPRSAPMCHCKGCRVAHAAPLYTVIYFQPSDINVVSGADGLKDYMRARSDAAHVFRDNPVNRRFCGDCGTRMMNIVAVRDMVGVFPNTSVDDADVPKAWSSSYENHPAERVVSVVNPPPPRHLAPAAPTVVPPGETAVR
eukprot:TRINITY_DN46103_c0_g1_i1.p1 TRINITY_DN46103_c0_g1~~TRINITY_DN46103_c0_g1_i1.p1  ORF type:complete len:163 (-),score=11.27 TRINITY_DN46103_c0_g1_i1:20-508(-)